MEDKYDYGGIIYRYLFLEQSVSSITWRLRSVGTVDLNGEGVNYG